MRECDCTTFRHCPECPAWLAAADALADYEAEIDVHEGNQP